LTLNENDIGPYRSFLKLTPPLRHEDDRQAVVAGLAEGVIDVPVKTVGFFVRAADNAWMFTLGTEFLAAITIIVAFWDTWYLLFR
jgi:hypothetical protein